MPLTFTFTARKLSGEKLSGDLRVDTKERALELLDERQLIVTSLSEKKEKPEGAIKAFFAPDYSQEIVMFARHLATYHRSGIPMLKALSLIKVAKAGSEFQRVLAEVRQMVSEGKTLSSALAQYPRVFSSIMVNAVESGETSGHLSNVLDETSTTLERDLELRRQIRSALRYPLMVIIAIVLAITVIVTVVVPKFAGFYSKFGAELPGPTRAIIWLSDMAQDHWLLALLIVGALAVLFRKLRQTKRGTEIWDRFLLGMPIFGELIIKASVARFALLFNILFKAGIPIVSTLRLLEDSQNNVHLRREIAEMRESFESGRELGTESEQNAGRKVFFPEMAINMIKSGLESGSLEMMLKEIGDHYSHEVERTSKNLASLIEPIMTVVIGGIVLLLALAIFLPMWNLIKVFQ